MRQKFWWGHKKNYSKIDWMNWEHMVVPKNKGGLGFRNLIAFNKAVLLAKQVWRLSQQPDSLVAKIFKSKYHPLSLVLEASKGKNLLWFGGAIWRIGDGKSLKVWGDCWLPTPTTFSV